MPKVRNKKIFTTYAVMGKRNGKILILGYSRNIDELKGKLRNEGWKDSELLTEILNET